MVFPDPAIPRTIMQVGLLVLEAPSDGEGPSKPAAAIHSAMLSHKVQVYGEKRIYHPPCNA